MVPIGRHILKYRPLVLTSGAIGIRIVPIRAPVARGVLAGEHRVRSKKKMQREGVFREMKLRGHLAQIGRMFES